MKSLVIAVAIMLMLGVFGQAAAQTFGTKVQAMDPDVGLPLAPFSVVGSYPSVPPVTTQFVDFLSYWDIGSTPGLYDDKDVVYLQFGSAPSGAQRIARENNIRLTGWGPYEAGSKVKAGDSDMGQQLLPWTAFGAPFPAPWFAVGFHYMDVSGGSGSYDIGDPIYLKAGGIGPNTNTNDIRITQVDNYPAGSRVKLSDTDGGKPLIAFKTLPPYTPAGGPNTAWTGGPVANLWFFNANGNALPAGPIYDDGDLVYLHIGDPPNPSQNVVTPGDVRLF